MVKLFSSGRAEMSDLTWLTVAPFLLSAGKPTAALFFSYPRHNHNQLSLFCNADSNLGFPIDDAGRGY